VAFQILKVCFCSILLVPSFLFYYLIKMHQKTIMLTDAFMNKYIRYSYYLSSLRQTKKQFLAGYKLVVLKYFR